MLQYFSSAFSALLLFFFASSALAMEVLTPPTTPDGGSAYSFARVVLGIVIKIAVPALVVLIVFFAFRMVVAQGDEKGLEEAKHHFKIVLIVVTIFLALGIIAAIIYNTGGQVGYVQLFPANPAPIDSQYDAEMNSKLFK